MDRKRMESAADLATSIGREWLERLRRDAALWTQPGPANPVAPSNYGNAKRLVT